MGCGGSKDAETQKAKPETKAGNHANPEKDRDKKQAKEENNQYQQRMAFLQKVALFKRLPKDQHPILAAACVQKTYQPNEVVIKQGDAGDAFYVIQKGEASVSVKVDQVEKQVATLKQGDYFGENALLREEPRTATITAKDELVLYMITREKFKEEALNEKLQFASRKAVGIGGGRTVATKKPSPKSDEERLFIQEALSKNENLKTMVQLDQKRINELIAAAWNEDVDSGKEIITEGDMVADYFYIVSKGSFEIFVTSADESLSAEKRMMSVGMSTHVSTVNPGGCFGELALLYLVPRAATVKAKEPSSVWVIDRTKFKEVLMTVSNETIEEYVKHLDKVQIFEALLKEEKNMVAKALREMHFVASEVVLQQGEPGNTFYILYDGTVKIDVNGVTQQTLQAKEQAHYFGERALINNAPRAATVTVVSETAKALALDKDSFDMLLGPLENIMKENEKGVQRTEQNNRKGATVDSQKKKFYADRTGQDKIMRKDLVRIGVLGYGGFGTVELWEHKKTGETYAMKALSKGYIVKTRTQDSVMNEKNILLMTNSKFIIKLFETYNGAQTLYFLMEPALGGELYTIYNRKGFHGSEKHAKYYVAGIVFAFEHMHLRHIIYRDLKPENLLLDSHGHLKLTDMGLAKFVIGRTYTTCGTPDYFAPELIASTGHTNAVDWWTLGILTFELMSGHAPFESANPMQVYSKVMKGVNKVQFPAKCQGDVGDLIKGLLQKEPSERLPMRTGGTKNLKEHAWYNNFDWAKLEEGNLEAPYKPVVKNKKDIANFAASKEDMPQRIEYKDDGSGWDEGFAT